MRITSGAKSMMLSNTKKLFKKIEEKIKEYTRFSITTMTKHFSQISGMMITTLKNNIRALLHYAIKNKYF